MDGYLEHGKFKYIDKYKSKSGKWVYIYKKNASDFLKSASDAGGKMKALAKKQIANATKNKPHATNKKKSGSDWHATWNDRLLSTQEKKKYIGTVWDDNQRWDTRIRKVTNPITGKKEYRREFSNQGENANLDRRVKWQRTQIKSEYGKVGRFLADMNDKYGPKGIYTITEKDRKTGEVFVQSYRYNLIGDYLVGLEDQYSYFDKKSKKVKKTTASEHRSGKKRNARDNRVVH